MHCEQKCHTNRKNSLPVWWETVLPAKYEYEEGYCLFLRTITFHEAGFKEASKVVPSNL